MNSIDEQYKHKRILITGACGFVGRNLVDFLIKQGHHQVYAISRRPTIDRLDSQVVAISADIRNEDEVNDVILQVKPSIIFHLAADINPSRDIDDLKNMINTNIVGTVNLLSSIVRHKVELDCFINTGTCEEYGYNPQPYMEEMVTSPVSIYSGTKAATDVLVTMFYNLYQIPVVTVRPSLVYGPGQSGRFFIPQLVEKLLLNQELDMTFGEQTRDYIYIDDVIEGLVEISKSNKLRGEVVNLCFGESVSLREVVELTESIANSNIKVNLGAIPYRQGEIMTFAASNNKLKLNTNWTPKVSLIEGLTKLVAIKKGELI